MRKIISKKWLWATYKEILLKERGYYADVIPDHLKDTDIAQHALAKASQSEWVRFLRAACWNFGCYRDKRNLPYIILISCFPIGLMLVNKMTVDNIYNFFLVIGGLYFAIISSFGIWKFWLPNSRFREPLYKFFSKSHAHALESLQKKYYNDHVLTEVERIFSHSSASDAMSALLMREKDEILSEISYFRHDAALALSDSQFYKDDLSRCMNDLRLRISNHDSSRNHSVIFGLESQILNLLKQKQIVSNRIDAIDYLLKIIDAYASGVSEKIDLVITDSEGAVEFDKICKIICDMLSLGDDNRAWLSEMNRYLHSICSSLEPI